jgi:hypothetical protein
VTSRRLRALPLVRGLWALCLLGRSRSVLRLWHAEPTSFNVGLVRVLGVRHALQSLAEFTWWPRGKRVGVVVDLLHAASAFGVAALDPRRRAPRYDGVVASLFALGGAGTSRRTTVTRAPR